MKKNFSFNISRSPIYRKLNNNLNLKLRELHKLAKRQKEFDTPRPVRDHKRFISFKESLTGVDPFYKYINFMKKDIIKPLERPLLYNKFVIKTPTKTKNISYNTEKNKEAKWAVGTVARAPNEDKLPKRQQFKIYYFPPEYNNKDPEKYQKFFLTTDHIGIKIPRLSKTNSDKSFIKMKADYSSSNETKTENQWVPYIAKNINSNNNISSKDYNIINFRPINSRKNIFILNKSVNFRKKGVSEYNDLTNVYNSNFNKEYSTKFLENPKRFYKYNGAFTNMYDASIRNGRITLPFDLKQN